jgi:hypothetical protein
MVNDVRVEKAFHWKIWMGKQTLIANSGGPGQQKCAFESTI